MKVRNQVKKRKGHRKPIEPKNRHRVITERVIASLREEGYLIIEYGHAIRINDVIDLCKNQTKFFVIGTNERVECGTDFELLEKIKAHIKRFPKRNSHLEPVITAYAEDYHWKRNEAKTSDDLLYFITHNEAVKIGRSKNVESRVKQLKTSLSHAFQVYVIPNKGCMESVLHMCFSELRTTREWFKQHDRISNFINKHAVAFEIKNNRPQSKPVTHEYKMKFGKYKDTPIGEVPNEYLAWAIDNVESLKPTVRAYIASRLSKAA